MCSRPTSPPPGNNPCATSFTPYISNCSYDGAKAVLSQFYGTLQARNNAPAVANYREFNQREFTNNLGMADTGWVYVPATCAADAKCKLHVALHGCTQDYATIGDKFVKNTGYTRWADTNNMIVLFPQARRGFEFVSDALPMECSPTPIRAGTQSASMALITLKRAVFSSSAIKTMIDRLSAGSH